MSYMSNSSPLNPNIWIPFNKLNIPLAMGRQSRAYRMDFSPSSLSL